MRNPVDGLPPGTIYTCPMHPQIRQVGPGHCPICGMTLEPVTATADVGPNHELVNMTRRFWVGLVLTLPVFVLEMGGHIPALGLHDLVPPRISTGFNSLCRRRSSCGPDGRSSNAPGHRSCTAA